MATANFPCALLTQCQCDLQEPQCSGCQKTGVRCSGPSKSTVFVHAQPDTFLHDTSSRVRLVEAYRARSQSSGRSRQFYQLSAGYLQAMRLSAARLESTSTLHRNDLILSGRPCLWEPLYRSIVHEFEPTSTSGIFSGDRNTMPGTRHYSSMAISIRALLPFACRSTPVADTAIFSLLTMYYGRLHGNSGLVDLARSSYTVALGELGRYLPQATSKNPDITSVLLCASVALSFFENICKVSAFGPAHMTHLEGSLQLLQTCGQAVVRDSPALKLLLGGLRTSAVYASIQRRQPGFLSEPEWNGLFHRGSEATARDRLIAIAFEIPKLLEAVDTARLSADNSSKFSERIEALLDDIRQVQEKLQSWMEDLDRSIEGELFWPSSQPLIGRKQQIDAECQPKHRSSLQQLSFISGTVAGLLVHYWSFQLELLTAEQMLQQLPHTTPIRHATKSTRHSADEVAQLIMESQPYLASCFEGVICLELPMESVRRYLAQSHV